MADLQGGRGGDGGEGGQVALAVRLRRHRLRPRGGRGLQQGGGAQHGALRPQAEGACARHHRQPAHLRLPPGPGRDRRHQRLLGRPGQQQQCGGLHRADGVRGHPGDAVR